MVRVTKEGGVRQSAGGAAGGMTSGSASCAYLRDGAGRLAIIA